ncbi:hypothetical protein MNBD_GAMMA23-2265 [hydrothermal vent metagenome]|uniref:Coenzyme PQQ synthesis protein D (PqqD) n=1 Tax=hydrothermal vent metagenome TaxID=652676 RepID=A0A3B1A1X0_9ZZZZ
MNLVIRANLSTQQIDGELVILDKDNGQIHQLNSVASFIWQKMEVGLDIDAIVQKLIQFYEIDATLAKADLDKVLQQFKDLKLLIKI